MNFVSPPYTLRFSCAGSKGSLSKHTIHFILPTSAASDLIRWLNCVVINSVYLSKRIKFWA